MKKMIQICICTYKRAEILFNLLESLSKITVPADTELSILVVDNDGNKSAEEVIARFQEDHDIPIRYLVEQQQSIALARNKILNNATGELLAFIDDDEFPEKEWLHEMYGTLNRYRAQAVLGPVRPYFQFDPPAWIKKSDFFKRPEYKTGTSLNQSMTRSGNVLINRHVIESLNLRFDESFSGGGEDRDFFGRLLNLNQAIIWCNEGIVHEIVTPERCLISTQIKRALLRGKMAIRKKGFTPLHVIKSVIAVIAYTLLLPFIFVFKNRLFYKFFISIFDHLGKILSFMHINPVKEVYIS